MEGRLKFNDGKKDMKVDSDPFDAGANFAEPFLGVNIVGFSYEFDTALGDFKVNVRATSFAIEMRNIGVIIREVIEIFIKAVSHIIHGKSRRKEWTTNEDELGYFQRPTEKQKSHRPLHVTAYMSGICVNKVLVDGGAAISLLPERMLTKVGKHSDDLIPTNLSVIDYNEGLNVKLHQPKLDFPPTGWE
ncbi:hypothetical protein Ahy_B05g074889 [Arachis hypogaea]|uniref:Peptidase A2 domain-containing protein n=1 Tax=Arachis hypogaea TaxID=3818 RepID=A0A444Z016_ARAHY|nr:hypothetical protein Ahy_B05g074889 [Arachis hypogaea]